MKTAENPTLPSDPPRAPAAAPIPAEKRAPPSIQEHPVRSVPLRPLKFYIETFGCQMNTADSEEMARVLISRGFLPTSRRGEADWILVNTCTVRQHAEDRAKSYLGRLRPWKRQDPRRKLLVAGCAAERLQGTLRSRFPHVDMIVGAQSIAAFDRLIDEHIPETDFDGRREFTEAWDPDADFAAFLPAETVTANVTIMRGCNYSCAYCIVPAVRGREIYRPADSVLAEIRQKVERGLREVLLLGQTVNSYRPRPGGASRPAIADFADLIRAVDRAPGVRRVRYMSPHPFYVNERFLNTLSESENVCPHIHLPVQSGSDAVLKRMRRTYTRAEYLRRAESLRSAVPGIEITTDLIAGFPGETEEDFRATLSLVGEAGFESAYCFKYSPRPGTEAGAQPDDVPSPVKEERLARLLELTRSLSQKKAERFHGTAQEVLIERILPAENQPRGGKNPDPGTELAGGNSGDSPSAAPRDRAPEPRWYEGRNKSFWKIAFAAEKPYRAGDFAAVTITGTSNGILRGRGGR